MCGVRLCSLRVCVSESYQIPTEDVIGYIPAMLLASFRHSCVRATVCNIT